MPFQKLIHLKRFSKLRIRQLFDDCRIETAHFSSIKHGKTIIQFGRKKRLLDCIKRYARARGLLWALGYSIPPFPIPGKVQKKETTPEFKKMFKLALPSIKYYYRFYEGKVKRA